MMGEMAMSDHAFLWETEAMRASRHEPHDRRGGDWLTLRQASEETGISITTLRRWARNDRVPSYLEPTDSGSIRMISADAVRKKAAGDLEPLTHDRGAPETTAAASGPATAVTGAAEKAPETPPGTMLVPIDAWDKMLIQLGNLHQAGQELAEARERAAKAETEVRFLKERLAEQRQLQEEAPEPAKPPPIETAASPPPTTPVEPPPPSRSPGFTRLMWRAWRTRPKD